MPNTGNNIELLVKLGIDKSNKTDLQTQVDQLGKTLSGLKVNINIDQKAISALEKLSTMDFSKLTSSVQKTTKEVENMAVKSTKEVQESIKKASDALGMSFSKAAQSGFKDVEAIKRELKSLSPNIKVDFDVVDGKKQLDKIKASFERDGVTTTVKFQKSTLSDNGKDSSIWMPKEIQEMDRSLSVAAKNVDELVKKMNKLQTEGKISNEQFEKLTSSISNIDKNGGIRGLNAQLDQFVVNNKRAEDAIRQQEKAQKEQVAELKRQEEAQKKIIENEIKRKNLILDIERAMKSQTRTIDSGAARNLIDQTRQLDVSSKNFGTSLKQNQSALRQLRTDATEATRSNIGIVEAFQTAFTKFPIWMAASTAFFGVIRTAKEFGSIILDIDTKLTNLSKVMSDDADLEGVFDRATQSAERFGQSISQALDAYTEFARQGYQADELGMLADAGLVASNVGEITAQQASEYMTASLIQWKKDAKDAMGIIDSWNEISNNYATTTEKLAQGQARAGATARAMGLDFDQVNAIIGTVTASTKQSGNEIGNFLKNVLPKLVSNKSQGVLSDLGISLFDENENMRDVVTVYTEVANALKGVTDEERILAVEGLAGKYHISRMQALLDDLGSADSLYRNMYQSSVDSAGSATKENEKFMESLQARINLARVEIEKMALAMGDAFLSEGMIQGIKVFGDFLNVTTKVVESIGALPLILGTVGVATVAFSSKFRTLVVALASGTTGMSSARAASAGLTTGMTGAAVATTTLSTALRGVAAATGVGLVLLGIGAAAEFLIGKMGKARELQEQIEVQNRNLVESYSANKDTIKDLAEQYANLESAMEQGNPDLETQQEYYDVQKQLSELMPDLVRFEDSYGNQIFSTSAVLEKKIAILERQTEAVKRLEEAENAEARAAKIANAEKNIKNRQEQMDTVLNYADAKASSLSSQYREHFYNKEIKTYDDLLKAIEHFHNKRDELESQGNTRGANVMNKQAEALEKQLALYDKFSMSSDSSQLTLIEDTATQIETTIGSMNSLGESAKSLFQNLAYDIALAADNADDLEPLNQAFSELNLKKYSSELKNVDSLFKGLKNSSSENFTANAEKLKEATKILKESLFQDLDVDTANAYGKVIDESIAKAIQQESSLQDLIKTKGMSRQEALLHLQALGDESGAMDENTSAINEYVSKLREKATVEEQLAGVTQKQIDGVNDLIFMYQSLSAQTELNKEQTFLLADAKAKLAAIYPHLSDKTDIRIKDIQKEKEAQEILLQATQLSKQGKLTAEEDMTLNSALGTQARIKNIRSEIDAILKLDNVLQQMAVKQATMIASIPGQNVIGSAATLAVNAARSYRELIKLPSLTAELDSITSTFNGTVSSLKTSVDNASGATDKAGKSTKDSTAAAKEANKATKESIYITDKYKQALESVNAEIEKQQKLRSDMTEYSKQYRDSLQKEINLERQKSKLIQDQANALSKQIKSGKIAQTGTISSSSTSTSTQKLNGWGGKVTSGYGTRKDPFTGKATRHAGVDLAGAKGTRLDANVSGKVVFAGKGTGSSSGFGNYVTIQSEDGLKHIYAHLDKVVARLGQTITAGQQIGNIGSTGRSTGSHLHYQVNGANGAIDPTAFMQSAKSGKVTTTNNVASGVSNAQQDIDQAKSDLLGLQGDILSSQERIKQLELDIIDSQLAEFDNTRKLYQHTLDYENAKQEAISQTGKEYRASIDKQITAMNGQQAANQAELAFLEKLMVTGNLSASAMANMKDRTRELKIEMQQLGTAIEGANFEKIQSRMQAFDESQDDLQFIVDLTGEYMQTLTEGSEEYNKAANEQIAAMQKQQRMIRTQIDEHKNDLATKKLSAQATKDLQEKIEDLTISYWSLTNGIRSSSESLKEANLRMANEVADKLIASYKNYTEERKNAHMKTIEAEMKAEDKRHKQVVDSLNKELEAYRKIIQARLDMLDKEESERDYNKEIDELEKERLDTLSKINLLSMDDSFEARKQVAELTEKLNLTEEQIAEKRHDREIELRKENLNDLLDKKEEEIKGRQELEDQRYEHEKELIDKQKEYWEQYYNDLLNDERKFAKLREDVIAGNTDAIKAEFGKILDYFNDTMPGLENTLDGTMQAVGTSIRQNMIDNLKEAIDLMNQLGQNTPGNIPNTGQFNSDKGNGSPSTSPTVPPATGSPSGTKGTGLITVTKPINLWERKRGTDDLKMLKVLQPGEQFRVYGEESRKSFGKQYDVGANRWITDIPSHIKYSKFEKGGYTGMQEGWAQLHPEEFVLNKGMTKEALKMADLFDNLRRFINPIIMSGVSQPKLAGASNGDGDVVINFNIDKMNATKNEADSFSKRIQDTLKRNKGVR